MKCPRCSHVEDKVTDSRLSKDGAAIRRRRECQKCAHRFSTIEEILPTELFVIKRDESREEFDPKKLRDGIEKACYKLRVREEQIDQLMNSILGEVDALGKTEVSSKELGQIVMTHLQKFNDVAYVRFASVYRQFRDIEQFIREIRLISERQK